MKILLVEDDEVLGAYVRDWLGWLGHRVEWCLDARGALKKLLVFKADLAVVDWNLPDRSGTDLIRALRADQKTAALPIILTAASCDERWRKIQEEVPGLGLLGVLRKPAEVDDLARLLGRVPVPEVACADPSS